MKPELQIKTLAELDDLKGEWQGLYHVLMYGQWYPVKDYLTSYDAIIPLIQKQTGFTMVKIEDWIENNSATAFWYHATPAQLCEALLRATGKWIE